MNREQTEPDYDLIEALTENMRSTGARQTEMTYNDDRMCVNVRVVVCDLNFQKK